MKKIKIVQLENDQLDRQEQDRIAGGQSRPCQCECRRYPNGSDDASNSANAPKPPTGGDGIGGGGGTFSCRCSSSPSEYLLDSAASHG